MLVQEWVLAMVGLVSKELDVGDGGVGFHVALDLEEEGGRLQEYRIWYLAGGWDPLCELEMERDDGLNSVWFWFSKDDDGGCLDRWSV